MGDVESATYDWKEQRVDRKRTKLDPAMESAFQKYYKFWSEKAGIDPNPDSPKHRYDYRGAFAAGDEPTIDSRDKLYHWPSEFKDDDHPNRYVDGVDTKKAKK